MLTQGSNQILFTGIWPQQKVSFDASGKVDKWDSMFTLNRNSLSNEILKMFQTLLSVPKYFFNCLKQIESHVKKLSQLDEESKNPQIKVTESLQHLSDKLDDMENENEKDEKIFKLEEKIKDFGRETKAFQKVSMNQNNILVELFVVVWD